MGRLCAELPSVFPGAGSDCSLKAKNQARLFGRGGSAPPANSSSSSDPSGRTGNAPGTH